MCVRRPRGSRQTPDREMRPHAAEPARSHLDFGRKKQLFYPYITLCVGRPPSMPPPHITCVHTRKTKMLTPLVEQARTEFAGCLAAMQGAPTATSAEDIESRVRAFLHVAGLLQRGLEEVRKPGTPLHSAALRRDIEALRREQHEKDQLIARQRERLRQWSTECQAIQSAQQAQLALFTEPISDSITNRQ